MDYQQTTQFLFSQLPVYQRDGKSAYKANLNNTIALDTYFNHPHEQFMTIHVAGTNGKGSVSHMLAAILQHAGYKVGLYTSPHLKDFRERIRINGEPISEHEVINFVEQHKKIIESLRPSFFELTVAMAFHYFARQQIDIAVIETGLGGRLDSTNIITPLISVITNIGFDHVQFLGNTLRLIAGEKAGIIKPNIPVIIGETQTETAPVFLAKALELSSPIVFADQIRVAIPSEKEGKTFYSVFKQGETEFINLISDLQGSYQAKNILTVLAALNALPSNLVVKNADIIEGLKSVSQTTGLKGRWQIVQENPKIICDTGHNAEGISYVVKQLEIENYTKLHMVIGMVSDKDITKVLSLLPKNAVYYFTRASIPRAMNEQELMKQASNFDLTGSAFSTVAEAIASAKTQATCSDLIFIGGSTFVVAEVPEL